MVRARTSSVAIISVTNSYVLARRYRIRRLAWTGFAPLLRIRAVHAWTFEPQGTGTRVYTEASLEGLLPRLFPGLTSRILAAGLRKSIVAPEAEVERRGRAA